MPLLQRSGKVDAFNGAVLNINICCRFGDCDLPQRSAAAEADRSDRGRKHDLSHRRKPAERPIPDPGNTGLDHNGTYFAGGKPQKRRVINAVPDHAFARDHKPSVGVQRPKGVIAALAGRNDAVCAAASFAYPVAVGVCMHLFRYALRKRFTANGAGQPDLPFFFAAFGSHKLALAPPVAQGVAEFVKRFPAHGAGVFYDPLQRTCGLLQHLAFVPCMFNVIRVPFRTSADQANVFHLARRAARGLGDHARIP